jgi:hypothetical protein
MTFIPSKEFLIQVAAGDIAGHSIVHKFGEASVGTTLQPVTESGFYRTPTTATALEFVSSDANDTSAGTGAREVTVVGLDASWNEVSQTVTTNGTSAVALSTNLIRLYRWFVSSSGTYADASTGSHAGTMTIRESGGGATWSTIGLAPFAEGQSEIACYTIPAGKTGYILTLDVVADSNKRVDAVFFQRPNADDVSAPYSGTLRVVNKFLQVQGEVSLRPQAPIGPFVGPCDIGFMAEVTSGTGDIEADFELILIDD